MSNICKHLLCGFSLAAYLRHLIPCLKCLVILIFLFLVPLHMMMMLLSAPPPPPHLIKITCSGEGTECTKCYAGGSQHHFILLYCTALYLSRALDCTVSFKMCTCIPLEPFCVPLSCIALRVASPIHFISLHCKCKQQDHCSVLYCIALVSSEMHCALQVI